MGREVRRVSADWQHPKAWNSHRKEEAFVPLLEGDYAAEAADWDEAYAKWQEGLTRNYGEGPQWIPIEEEYRGIRFTDYAGKRPSPDDYMPNWPAEERTHLMMYEDTSEGTPISPAFKTPEELARWLVNNEASAFAGQTASYEGWLAVARGAFAPSVVMCSGAFINGVDAARDHPTTGTTNGGEHATR